MAYVITEPCIDVKDRSCVDVCPVDCIHEEGDADRMLYINPMECIDCGACEPACPVRAIFAGHEVPQEWWMFAQLNADWYKSKDNVRVFINAINVDSKVPEMYPQVTGPPIAIPQRRDDSGSDKEWRQVTGPPKPIGQKRGRNRSGIESRRVFVVHGRDEGAKEKVARFLARLDLEPVILHEQPNQGRTIMEKFEQQKDIAFAVVLLTADDFGVASGKSAESRPRARQNVVFECGFFVGRLGRSRVCVLCEEAVERPSDLEGIVYIPLDSGDGWKIQLARDMKAVGLDINLNRAI